MATPFRSVASVPLQAAGVPELLLYLLLLVASIAVTVIAARWVYRDATRRDNPNAGLWATIVAVGFLMGLLPGVLAMTMYLVTRTVARPRSSAEAGSPAPSPSPGEQVREESDERE